MKEISENQKRLDQISYDSNSLYITIKELTKHDPYQNTELFLDLAEECIYKTAKINISVRNLLFQRRLIDYHSSMKRLENTINLDISLIENNNYLKLSIPFRIAKIKNRFKRNSSQTFLNEVLDSLCCNYCIPFLNIKNESYHDCCIIFCHLYERNSKYVYDYDNLDYSPILNILKKYFLQDDNGLICDIQHITRFSKTNRTEIYITERKNFISLYLYLEEKYNK